MALDAGLAWNDFKDSPCPATASQIAQRMKDVPVDAARYQLYLYEFGAFRDTTPPDSRVRYLHDVRRALEETALGGPCGTGAATSGLVIHDAGSVVSDAADAETLDCKVPE